MKYLKTIYKNGNGPCSRQQKHLHNILGGELNYPVDKCLLDIAFPEEMIYIEYDGSGHNWWERRYGSKNKAQQKDLNRKNYLQKQGWKLIKYITSKDKLLNDNIIVNLVNKAKNYLLNTNHSWFEIDIDNNKINCAEYSIKIEEGILNG